MGLFSCLTVIMLGLTLSLDKSELAIVNVTRGAQVVGVA